MAIYINGFGALKYVVSYQAYINSYQYQPDYFCNWKLEEGCKTADNIDKFKGNFADNLELYQSFKALHAHIKNIDGVKIEDSDRLSNRELDYSYNWGMH